MLMSKLKQIYIYVCLWVRVCAIKLTISTGFSLMIKESPYRNARKTTLSQIVKLSFIMQYRIICITAFSKGVVEWC